jgi:hypothetical protein
LDSGRKIVEMPSHELERHLASGGSAPEALGPHSPQPVSRSTRL